MVVECKEMVVECKELEAFTEQSWYLIQFLAAMLKRHRCFVGSGGVGTRELGERLVGA